MFLMNFAMVGLAVLCVVVCSLLLEFNVETSSRWVFCSQLVLATDIFIMQPVHQVLVLAWLRWQQQRRLRRRAKPTQKDPEVVSPGKRAVQFV
jgi:hypothetical protein